MANVTINKALYQKGMRIRLNYMEGESDMPSGLKGTVQHVDDIGQIHMKWDNGRTLALNSDKDSFSIISRTFTIPVRFTGRVMMSVVADSEEEAIRIANERGCEVDCGELEDVDWETKSAVSATE